MKSFFTTLILTLILATTGFSQHPVTPPDLFSDHPKTKMLLLGVFHFDNPGLDDYQPQHQMDIKSKERQKQIKQIVQKLKVFQPTKIGLEFTYTAQSKIDSLYQLFMDGEFELPANEIYQLGFRLAKKLGLQNVHGIDAEGKNYSKISELSEKEYNRLVEKYKKMGLQAKPNTKIWYPIYKKLYAYGDSLKTVLPLQDYLLYLNSPERIRRSHGIYLVDSFKFGIGRKGDYFGADMKTYWYNRNLRILQNIYRIIDSPEDRVLIVIGAGHLPILRHAVKTSPEMELVDVDKCLK